MKYYTVYRDEEIIAFGTAKECTKKLQLKDCEQFYALVSKAKSGLRPRYSVVVEELNLNNRNNKNGI